MRILVTNDDGVHARGIKTLAEALEPLGEVWVIAPLAEQSGTSHSISLHRPLRIHRFSERIHAVDGTPSDAVYLGVHHLLRDRRPDVVVSGINHGANLADDITYSGTVAAATEACMMGLPAIAISQAQRGGEFDFAAAGTFARSLVSALGEHRIPKGVLLNVNVPKGSDGATYRVTRVGKRSYGAEVIAKTDPRGRPYFWIGGDELAHEDIPGSDANTVYDDRIISVTPLHLDATHDPTREALRTWRLPGAEQR